MLLTQIQIDELKRIVHKALVLLYESDPQLIERAVNERSLVFRFGIYLNDLLRDSSFSDLDLDCEYNRNLGDSKRTVNFQNGVIPDVLVHRRNSNNENILVLEFKGYWNRVDRENDHGKIRDFTSQNPLNDYKYGLGAVVEIGREEFFIDYYIDYTPN